MPIIINDFEILVEPNEPNGSQNSGPAPANAPPATLKPEDVVRILRRQQERKTRLRAD